MSERAPVREDGTAEADPSASGERPRPGQMSELLRRIARDPVSEVSTTWEPVLIAGATIDRFELVRELGRGGFGLVWEAIDRKLGRRVAFKAVRRGPGTGQGGEQRLLAEAEVAARLQHPNIVTIYDVGDSDGRPYLVLELLRGETLSARLERGALPPAEAVRLAREIARGVAHAHGKGVVHRDLKPANVFLCDDGQVKVLDLGLAHALGHVRAQGGTPGYMAPEQARGAPEDERTDVFALGVVLFRMLSGKSPFADELALRGGREAPRLEVPGAPELGELVARLLQKDPVRRPRDAGEVVRELERILPPSLEPVRVHRRTARTWMKIVAAGVALGLAAAAAREGVKAWRAWRESSRAQPVVLAIADIENLTGDPELDDLSRLFRVLTAQSPRAHVLARSHLVDLATRGAVPPERLDEATATGVAKRAGADVIVTPRLTRIGRTFVLELRAVHVLTGAVVAAFVERAEDKDHVPMLLEQASSDLRRSVGESEQDVARNTFPAARVTPLRAAASLYGRAMSCFDARSYAGSFRPCAEELERALDLDPGFALAALELSIMRFFDGAPLAEQRRALAVALANPDRIPPTVKSRLEGWQAYVEGREDSAKSLLRESAESSVDDRLAWFLAAEVPFHRDEFAEALPSLRRAHELAPPWLVATQHLVEGLVAIGDLEAVGRLAGEASNGPGLARCYVDVWARAPTALATCTRLGEAAEPGPRDELLATALLNQGSRDELRAHLGHMGDSTFATYMRLWLLVQEGRWAEVEPLLRSMEKDGEGDAWYWADRALVRIASGDTVRGLEDASKAAAMSPPLATSFAVHLAYAGDLRAAGAMARFVPDGSPRRALYLAVVRWREGDLPGALPALKGLAARARFSADLPAPPALFLLGEALSEAGRDAEAVEVLAEFASLPVTTPSWFLPRARFLLARSLERLGRLDEARKEAVLLDQLWRKAEPPQPMLQEASRLVQRLSPR